MKKKVPKADYDSPWKEAIGLYFESFLEFFFPHIWADIDWSKGYTMLDKELQKAMGRAALGRREVDALVKVIRRSGVEQWVLIHVEVQSQVDPHFGLRMSVYHARIREHHGWLPPIVRPRQPKATHWLARRSSSAWCVG